MESSPSGLRIERLKTAGKKALASAMAQVALFSAPIVAHGMETRALDARMATQQTTKVYDLDIAVVDAGGKTAKYTDAYIRGEVQDAEDMLSFTTDSSVQLGRVDLHHMTMVPA